MSANKKDIHTLRWIKKRQKYRHEGQIHIHTYIKTNKNDRQTIKTEGQEIQRDKKDIGADIQISILTYR